MNVCRDRRERSPALTLAGTPNAIPAGRLQALNNREAQVMALVAPGYTNDQTAHRLGTSSHTVGGTWPPLFGKGHMSSRAAAVAWWLGGR